MLPLNRYLTLDQTRVSGQSGLISRMKQIRVAEKGIRMRPISKLIRKVAALAAPMLITLHSQAAIYAIQTNGFWTPFSLGINADQFRLIPTNQDLYCAFWSGADSSQSMVLKLSRTYFSGHAGDILIEESGEAPPGYGNLYILHWDTVNNAFRQWRISLPNNLYGHFEGCTFAPIDIPPIPQ